MRNTKAKRSQPLVSGGNELQIHVCVTPTPHALCYIAFQFSWYFPPILSLVPRSPSVMKTLLVLPWIEEGIEALLCDVSPGVTTLDWRLGFTIMSSFFCLSVITTARIANQIMYTRTCTYSQRPYSNQKSFIIT